MIDAESMERMRAEAKTRVRGKLMLLRRQRRKLPKISYPRWKPR